MCKLGARRPKQHARARALPKRISAREKLDAYRRGNFKDLAGPTQSACLGIDPEDGHRVRVLICGQEELSRGIDAKAARDFALGRLVFHVSEPARFFIDAKNRDGVMAAVRAVQEFPRRMHDH